MAGLDAEDAAVSGRSSLPNTPSSLCHVTSCLAFCLPRWMVSRFQFSATLHKKGCKAIPKPVGSNK